MDGGSLLDSFFDWRPSSSFRRTPVALEQETVNEGQELYLHFFHERLRREGLAEAAAQEEARLDEYHDHSTHLVEEESSFFSTGRRRRTRTQSMNLGNFQVLLLLFGIANWQISLVVCFTRRIRCGDKLVVISKLLLTSLRDLKRGSLCGIGLNKSM